MSCDTQRLLKNTEHFKLLCSLKYEDTIPFSMYRSKITKITVCIAEVEGPFVDGDFNIVTETFDNDGLPYALEHLIFTGTKDHPYDNILKVWAVKSLASDITGSTLQNRTCFSIRAAGSKGFLNLMPLYLDHILFPSLEDSAYRTKVHHITGKGTHGGVVYCKTQEKERTSEYKINKKMLQKLYPGNCGYNSVILGITKNLRENTNIERVKQFHKKFYRPENLTILITGKIQPDEIFQALLPLEEKIMSKKRNDKFDRPWQTQIKPLKKSADVKVFFPSDTEKYCKVHVAWRGPSIITQLNDYYGCCLLLKYLEETSSSLLIKKFGKIGDYSLIMCFASHWSDPYLEIIFTNVPIEHIDLITKKFINQVLTNVHIDGINMETMKTVLNKFIFDFRCDMEYDPHRKISYFLFDHVIYENTPKNFKKRLNMLCDFEKLKDKSETYFLTLLKKYFVDAPMVFVKSIPSLDMQSKLQEEETNVTEQTKKLGRKYLQQKEKELQEATKETLKTIPYQDLCKVPMPGIDSITFHHIKRYNTETAKQHPKFDVKKLPLFTYLDDVDTNFFHLQIIMDISSFTEDKPYIQLINEIITESLKKRQDQLIPYEKVKDLLVADNIKVQCHINTSEHIPHTMSLILQAELHNYEKTVQWCKELLHDTILTAESIKTKAPIITQILDDDIFRGESLAEILMTTLIYTDDSHKYMYYRMRCHKFFTDVQERFTSDVGQKEVITKIQSVRRTLTSPKNMFVHMAVNVNKLTKQFPDVFAPWNNFKESEKTKVNITSNLKLLKPSNIYNGCIMGLDWIQSSFFIQTCPCINEFTHSDLPALEVCLTYLRQIGGPIWVEFQERQTLLNQFGLYTTVDNGYLNLKFISSTNVVAAYKKMKSVVETHLAGTKWNKFLYEQAKSLVILKYITNIHTIKNMINASVTSYRKNLPHDYDYEMVQRVSAVTTHDMSRVTTKYIKPLFDPKQCKIAIVCNDDKVAEIKEAFQKMKFNFNVFQSLDELIDYIIKDY